ncbi:hypothetical protein COS59_01780, partial [Candidatus Wolfebacteria bacterium CG03_land_8_20_14_0_80_36_15]
SPRLDKVFPFPKLSATFFLFFEDYNSLFVISYTSLLKFLIFVNKLAKIQLGFLTKNLRIILEANIKSRVKDRRARRGLSRNLSPRSCNAVG